MTQKANQTKYHEISTLFLCWTTNLDLIENNFFKKAKFNKKMTNKKTWDNLDHFKN
jgi:hypothetical protein